MLRRAGGYLEIEIEEETGGYHFRARFYNQPWLMERFPQGTRALVSGRLARTAKGILVVEDHGVLQADEDLEPHRAALHPSLPTVEGVPPGTLRRLIEQALERVAREPDPLPEDLRHAAGVPPLLSALRWVHRPAELEDAYRGGERLLFDRLLARVLPLARTRAPDERAPSIVISETLRSRIRARFPFRLTAGQEAALDDILKDLARDVPMRRLLQGDVGSGKTAVAVAASLAAIAGGCQVLLLAPTEPLAHQHALLIRGLLAGSRVEVGYLSAKVSGEARHALLANLAAGTVHLLVGTQAALQGRVTFQRLGLVIVDEQHRFGVRQRLSARSKGEVPHMLAMSATPIPRTLCLALLGDLDSTVIRDRPPGRLPVATHVSSRDVAMAGVRSAVARGERAFVIFPAIDSEDMPAVLRDGCRMVAQAGPLAGMPCAFLHGRLTLEERERALSLFTQGCVPLLLGTLMVEVGIDVPEATVMVVVGADRFGLATLHQLRGRVGRGDRPAECHLVPSDAPSPMAEARLAALTRMTDGFQIAEADLDWRGPGELLGVRQAGPGGPLPLVPGRDRALLETALVVARDLIGRQEVPAQQHYAQLLRSLDSLASCPADAV
jgi:ATP-dependent DNA helicase RecG